MNAVATATRIRLLGGCASPHCLKMAGELWTQLETDYARGAAIMPLQGTINGWLESHRTARKRSNRTTRAGYWAGAIERQEYEEDIYLINTSAKRRQGRPMSKGYLERPKFGDNPIECRFHHVYTYGVLAPDGALVAYLWLYRSGELAMVSSILGRVDRLEDGIMYLLYRRMLNQQFPLGGTVFYNLWNSGTDGLRFFKERVGLAEGDVEWKLT